MELVLFILGTLAVFFVGTLLVGMKPKPLLEAPKRRAPLPEPRLYPPLPHPPRRPRKPVEESRDLEVDLSGLRTLGLLPLREQWVEDLALLTGVPELAEWDGSRIGWRLTAEKLEIRWVGSEKPPTVRLAYVLQTGLAKLAKDPWKQVDLALASPQVGARHRLCDLAQKSQAVLDRVLPTLMVDENPWIAWKVSEKNSPPEHWVSLAVRYWTPPELRQQIVACLRECDEKERCLAAQRFAPVSELHLAAFQLLARAEGEEAEQAWMALGAEVEETLSIEMVALSLGRIGTRRCLPTLEAMAGKLGPLQFRLKDHLTKARAAVRERAGGVPGALSLAGPAPEAGAVSLASQEGGMSVATEGKAESL